MPVKGTYLAIAGGGMILVWSGLRGKSVGTSLRNVLSGKSPTQLSAETTAYPITTSQAAFDTGPAVQSDPNVPSPSGPGETAFWTALLTSLGAPPTSANVKSLVSWRTRECPWDNQPPDGAGYTHNPLNTTISAPGAVSINSAGVKRYPSAVIGIAATRKTLRAYPQIVAALRSGKGLCGSGLSAEFSTWSGGGYSSVC